MSQDSKKADGRAAFFFFFFPFFFLPLPYFPFHPASSIEVEPHPLVEIRLVTFFLLLRPTSSAPPPKCNVRQQQIVIPNRVTLPYNLPILVGEKGGTSIRRRWKRERKAGLARFGPPHTLGSEAYLHSPLSTSMETLHTFLYFPLFGFPLSLGG